MFVVVTFLFRTFLPNLRLGLMLDSSDTDGQSCSLSSGVAGSEPELSPTNSDIASLLLIAGLYSSELSEFALLPYEDDSSNSLLDSLVGFFVTRALRLFFGTLLDRFETGSSDSSLLDETTTFFTGYFDLARVLFFGAALVYFFAYFFVSFFGASLDLISDATEFLHSAKVRGYLDVLLTAELTDLVSTSDFFVFAFLPF